ncbi:MAG: hypothetical protein EBR40_09990 [Proteobacteria bacterium]|nr:hypothetical protein [Pseudomonadota bacterium]
MTTQEINLADLENELDPNVTRQQKLAEAKAAIAGTTPLIPDPPNCVVRLPRGLYQGGSWKTEAEVRELNGADEESLSRVKDASDFFDLVLAHGVVRVDDLNLASSPLSERQILLRELLIGERSQLLMAILVATYGEEKVLNITCGTCSEDQELTLYLSKDFKAKEVEDVAEPSFFYTTKSGDSVEYRLVTGSDQNEVLRRKGATTAEQNSVILSRCITKVNGAILPDPQGYARRLGMKDRMALLQQMVDRQPDLDLGVQTTCVACGGDIVFSLGWSDLFRP